MTGFLQRYLLPVVLAFWGGCNLYGQQEGEIRINGTVYGDSQQLEGVYVKNMSARTFTITTKSGNFTMLVMAGDTLRCIYLGMQDKVTYVTPAHLEKNYIRIDMEPATEQLGEVVVEQQTINEVSLGIVPHKMKEYTKSERALASSEFKAIQLLGILYGGLPLDPIISAISGRTKRLKRNFELDNQKVSVDALYQRFYVFSTLTLKIPEDDVMMFMYYLVDNGKDADILKAENSVAEFYLTEAYVQYQQENTERK